jgi:toxin ParE1/3/4
VADVILSERAKADLDQIDCFGIETFGPDVAADYMCGFHGMFETLSKFPEAGAVVMQVKPVTRCLTYRSHRIFYVFDAAEVRIIRILHHAMNARRHLLQ